jgi:transcriptional regulator with XRE-family HTH domain
LTSRRAKITPEEANLPTYGLNKRRVKGLRREEVAMLAGISVEYYTRLERGNATGVSDDVLEGIVRALRLDEAERSHLFDLVRAANLSSAGHSRRRPSQERIRPTVQRIVDSISAPAYVRIRRLDLLAANTLGFALYAPVFEDTTGVPNMARFIFLNQQASEFFLDWEGVANDAVAILRAEAGRDPYDKRTSDLIGELSTRSDEFRVRWAAHNVKFHRTGTKGLHHPVVGDLTLDYEALELAGDAGQRILVYSAQPSSPSAESLDLLASWAATPASPRSLEATDDTRN